MARLWLVWTVVFARTASSGPGFGSESRYFSVRTFRLFLVLLGVAFGASRTSSVSWDWLPFHSQTPTPLRDVLPGRWQAVYKGQTYIVTFGRHSDMSFLVNVPAEYRARLGTDQLWIGGNYHVQDDHNFNCQLTDGRWAELAARTQGLRLAHVGIKSYSEDKMVDGEDVTWTCLGHDKSDRTGEAVDIADRAPTVGDAPRASHPPANLYDEQKKLTALYKRLEEKRGKLNPKDKTALAAFNKEAAAYAQEVAAFNGGNGAAAQPTAAPMVTAARSR